MKTLSDIRPASWFKGAVYGLLLAGMYGSALTYLFFKDWTRDDYSYGYIIPFVVLYLIWDKGKAQFYQRQEPSDCLFFQAVADGTASIPWAP